MGHHEKTEKNPTGAGRPLKEIDWEKVKNLAIAGCTGTEIASHFDIHLETFYRRCQEDLGMYFTEFMGKYREKGQSMLRAQQFAKALGHTDKGDNTLLIWLGKQRLGQKENRDEQNHHQKVVFEVNYKNDSNTSVEVLPSNVPITDSASSE